MSEKKKTRMIEIGIDDAAVVLRTEDCSFRVVTPDTDNDLANTAAVLANLLASIGANDEVFRMALEMLRGRVKFVRFADLFDAEDEDEDEDNFPRDASELPN